MSKEKRATSKGCLIAILIALLVAILIAIVVFLGLAHVGGKREYSEEEQSYLAMQEEDVLRNASGEGR